MIWGKGWRAEVWDELDRPWDILVIGGGITGAGMFNQAARAGLGVLLVEANDFAFGTSSRSSKLVHGGFRYLRNRQFSVTRESVQERERLLRQGEHLVEPLEFILPVIGGRSSSRRVYQLGVTIYDLLAPKWQHGHLSTNQIYAICPVLTHPGVSDAFYYYDAVVDDARLVLRTIQEGVTAGGKALNYTRVSHLLKDNSGSVYGAAIEDLTRDGQGRTKETTARVVIQATGPWSDALRDEVNGEKRIRKQRGSHLVFPFSKLPLQQAITLFHPRDKRAMFVFPWEGVTVIGTTDLDHPLELQLSHPEPVATRQEVEYMLEAIEYLFPQSHLNYADVISTFAGLRPIVSSGTGNPSKELRAHSIWNEDGLFTITGGKLTTFRKMAYETLMAARPRLPQTVIFNPLQPIFQGTKTIKLNLDPHISNRLAGRYGRLASEVVQAGGVNESCAIDDLPALWSELRWGARAEAVEHLDDLLLRRTRLGMTLTEGARGWMERIRTIAQPELGWDDELWEAERNRYEVLWKECYFGL